MSNIKFKLYDERRDDALRLGRFYVPVEERPDVERATEISRQFRGGIKSWVEHIIEHTELPKKLIMIIFVYADMNCKIRLWFHGCGYRRSLRLKHCMMCMDTSLQADVLFVLVGKNLSSCITRQGMSDLWGILPILFSDQTCITEARYLLQVLCTERVISAMTTLISFKSEKTKFEYLIHIVVKFCKGRLHLWSKENRQFKALDILIEESRLGEHFRNRLVDELSYDVVKQQSSLLRCDVWTDSSGSSCMMRHHIRA